MNISILKAITVLLAMLLTLPGIVSASSDDPPVFIENPKPTHSEEGVPRSSLVPVKIFSSDMEEDVFFAKPVSLVVDEEASFFIYDSMFKKILKFDKNFKLVARFLGSGQGPGEVNEQGMGFQKLCYANGKVYIADTYNDKVIVFSKSGKHLKDIRMYRKGLASTNFRPEVDSKGNFYTLSYKNGIIDQRNPEMKITHTFLEPGENWKFVIYLPDFSLDPGRHLGLGRIPVNREIYYNILKGDRLAIFNLRSCTFYLFDGRRLVKKFDVLIDSTMKKYRKSIQKIKENIKHIKKKRVFFSYMYSSYFPDMDTWNHFYLQVRDEEGYPTLYKFDFNGKLVQIMKNRDKNRLYYLAKRHGQFYGTSLVDANAFIYKEEKKR